MAQDRKVNRHEIKYSVSLIQAELLKTRLGALLRPDPHAGPDGSYFIRSTYFDDPDFTAYHEKLDGVKERTKYRIRYYNFDESVIFLEKKTKDGDLTGKDSQRLTKAEAEALLWGDRSLSARSGLLGELGMRRRGVWKPAVIVTFHAIGGYFPGTNENGAPTHLTTTELSLLPVQTD